MATIKSFTDISQSKKLAEILPLESADMYYWCADHYPKEDWIIEVGKPDDNYECICAWSLAALLGIIPKEINIEGQRYAPCLFPVQDKWLLILWYNSNHTITSPIAIFNDNPVDACHEMIIKLHELNLL